MRSFESGGSWARPTRNHKIDEKLVTLEWKIHIELDRIHDEALAKFRALARSVGQRTRTDR